MSLRDYFAAKALDSCLTLASYPERNVGVHDFENAAALAYEMADAMLKERQAS